MKIPMYQVDAFTDKVFAGNPAAVCPMEKWPEDSVLQSIAAENNLSETAFFVPEKGGYRIRWFTPVSEVDLCGHATLASGYVLFHEFKIQSDEIRFFSKSGELRAMREGDLLSLNFPSQPPRPCEMSETLVEGLGTKPVEVLCSEDYFAVYSNEAEVRTLHPDMSKLRQLDLRGVIVTAPGDRADFVSRFFAPKVGIDEDPVTGSAHCALIPYWSKKLNKEKLHAQQLSRRGGELFCKNLGDRVTIAGRAVKFMEGQIMI